MNLITLETVGSTNDYARDLARKGCPEETVVRAIKQTAGRGRHGNSWTSLPGNLLMSAVLRPGISPAKAGQLSFLAAVALADTLAPLLPATASLALKWPNDILIDDRKAAGILLETETTGGDVVDWVVIGVGVNITAAPENAVCLHRLGVKDVAAGVLLETLVKNMMKLYKDWKMNGFGHVRAAWLARACNLGRRINVRLARESFSGIFAGLDEAGALLLDMPDGTRRTLSSGEVYEQA